MEMTKGSLKILIDTFQGSALGAFVGDAMGREVEGWSWEQIKARHVAQEAIRLGDSEYDKVELTSQIEREMLEAAETLDFERAAVLRDQLRELKELPELVLADSHKKKSHFLASKKQKRHKKKSSR